MARWRASQSPQDRRDTDDDLPSVNGSAMTEAAHLIGQVIAPRSRVDGEEIVIADWAIHELALRLEEIRVKGYRCDEE